jgi:hypothetical protein
MKREFCLPAHTLPMQEAALWIAVDGEMRPSKRRAWALSKVAQAWLGVFTTGAIVSARLTLLARHIERLRETPSPRAFPRDEPDVWSAWSESLRGSSRPIRSRLDVPPYSVCAWRGPLHPHAAPRAIVSAQPAAWKPPAPACGSRPTRSMRKALCAA